MVLFITFIICLIFGFVGSAIANEKNREPFEGFLYGFFLSVFGLIIVAVLPTREKKITPRPTPTVQKEIIKPITTYDPEKVTVSESKSVNTVIWLIVIVVLIMTVVLVGISTKQTQRDSKYTGSEAELNSVLISDENNSTQSDTSNEKLEEVNKPRSDKNELKVEVSKKKVLTKEEQVGKLSKIFDSVYGSEIAQEIARKIYSNRINIDSVSYFTLEDGTDKILTQYKTIKLFDSKRKQLNEFKDVRIQGFVEYESKTKSTNLKPRFFVKRNNLSQKEINVYPYKRRRLKELLNSLNITDEYIEQLLKYVDSERALLTGHQYDSISLSKTETNLVIVNFYFLNKYQGSIDFPFVLSD